MKDESVQNEVMQGDMVEVSETAQDEQQIDGYYGDDDLETDELDLSFLDEDSDDQVNSEKALG
jgi:hypothetical protein